MSNALVSRSTLLFGIAIFLVSRPVPAADVSTTKPSKGAAQPYDRKKIVDDLSSGDDTRSKVALDTVRQRADRNWLHRGSELMVLVDAKRYDEAEAMSVFFIRTDPFSVAMPQVEWVRIQNFMRQNKWQEALTASRSYYDCCALKDTQAAINLVAVCLIHARPDDSGIAKRFKQQQAAWADPATTTAPADSKELGAPILATIAVDGKTFSDALSAVELKDDFRTYMRKGNLLLICGHAKEAKAVFEQAEALASKERETADAIESQARALRADAGCIAPANSFLAELQK